MAAGDLQRHLAEAAPAVDDREASRSRPRSARPRRAPRRPRAPPRGRRCGPRSTRRATEGVGARVVGAHDEEARRVETRSSEGVEGGAVGLLGAVVVEVVGLDVGDQRGVRRVDEEGAVALVGLGDEQLAAAVVGVGAGLVELAADGEGRVGAAVLQRHGQQRGGGGLAVRAGDRDDRAALHHRLERGRSRQQPQPASRAPRPPRGCRRARRSRPPRCRRRRGWRRRARRGRWRRARAARRACATPWRRCRRRVMPRASMIRAMPESPAPPMPTKCTVPSWSAGSSTSGTGTFIGRPPPGAGARPRRIISASLSSASSGIRSRGGRRHRGEPARRR